MSENNKNRRQSATGKIEVIIGAVKMDHIKKISIKTVAGKPLRSEYADKPLHLMNVYGVVTSVDEIETAFGTSDKFRGSFRAVNNVGEKFAASVAYFPNILGDALCAELRPDVNGLEFAAAIGIAVSDDSPVGYVYTLNLPHTEESESAIDKLAERLTHDNAQALPPAKTEPVKAKVAKK